MTLPKRFRDYNQQNVASGIGQPLDGTICDKPIDGSRIVMMVLGLDV